MTSRGHAPLRRVTKVAAAASVTSVRAARLEEQLEKKAERRGGAVAFGKTMFGVVVAGLGIAGQVRIRDLLSPLPSSPAEKMSIKGFVSRRNLQEQQGVTQIPLDEALSREDIHAAIVSTENSSHEDYVRKFLEAGKHVCVEYPMALSYAAAVELFRLADEKGKVLHVEHIELLAADYRQLKKEVCGKSLQEGSLHFTAGPVAPGFGSLAFSGISRLTWLVDLFGELSVTGAKLTEEPEKKYTKLTAHLLTQDRRSLTWIEERGPGLRRNKTIDLRFDSGRVDQLPAVPRDPVGLFAQDLRIFGRKLLGQVATEALQAERKRVLHCLQLADRISQLVQAPQQSAS
ncbi:biliverdin reductase A isoform X3 [Scleropages formosus]|uniref:Biliverdin reductase A n=1 Tax=Scleropages formosus TaxID=113540 RepID=A0A8C9SSP6_SCLFO|nr:biliverdin reductase A isoform X3 [Scleropages formosus]